MDFVSIDNYYNTLKNINHEIGLILNLSDDEISNRTNEDFYANLHFIKRLEMDKHGITDIKEINKKISNIERLLSEKI